MFSWIAAVCSVPSVNMWYPCYIKLQAQTVWLLLLHYVFKPEHEHTHLILHVFYCIYGFFDYDHNHICSLSVLHAWPLTCEFIISVHVNTDTASHVNYTEGAWKVYNYGNWLGMPLLTGRLSVAVRDAVRLFLNLFSHSRSFSCTLILSRETEEETGHRESSRWEKSKC